MKKMKIKGIFPLKKRLMILSVPFFVFLFFVEASAQQGISFIYPLDVTMSLSGNYGELRGNHFHGGIDFRVGGVVGAPIKATADGYVSKISVSPTEPAPQVEVSISFHKNADKKQYAFCTYKSPEINF